MTKEEKVISVPYDKKQMFWAVMYRKQIVCLYPRGRDAEREVNLNNTTWKNRGWGTPWHVKRFKYMFKGEEIDAYEHIYQRTEKK